MKKVGFTLTEVLLALAIIGILAAVTIPQVAIGVEKRKAGAIIGRAVEQISLGCQNYIQSYNELQTNGGYTLSLNDIDDDFFKQTALETHMALTDPFISAEDKAKYAEKGIVTDGWKIMAKSPAYIMLVVNSGKNYKVTIDTNGFVGNSGNDPNQYEFILTDTCKMKAKSDNAMELTSNEFRFLENDD